MSVEGMHANQHLANQLRAIADNIETHAATLPGPMYSRVVIEAYTAEDAAVTARTLLGSDTLLRDSRGNACVERWLNSSIAIRIQGAGTGDAASCNRCRPASHGFGFNPGERVTARLDGVVVKPHAQDCVVGAIVRLDGDIDDRFIPLTRLNPSDGSEAQ